MPRMDDQIGFGRQNDSSSSRESSPQPKQKRSFSPSWDDGDPEVPPIADDDTPPPEQPILRQAVAFSWGGPSIASTPVNIDTYQATIAPVTTATFLPGQEVALPPAPPKKKAQRTRKPKNNELLAPNLGRFRLKAYDPTAAAPIPAQGDSATPPFAAVPTVLDNTGRGVQPAASGSQSVMPIQTSAKPTGGKAKGSNPKPSKPKGSKSNSKKPTPNPTSKQRDNTPNTNMASASTSSGQYYRRDYENEDDYDGDSTQVADTQRHGSPVPSESTLRDQMSPEAPERSKAMAARSERTVASKRKYPIRMVTLLIRDVRSREDDSLLAEVKVPLRPADNPADGFWADSQDICAELQDGPSRIDGPAQVYTLRGQFRQIFLRVSADNRDTVTSSSNISISPARTLDAVVDLPPKVGRAVDIPSDLRPSSKSPDPEDQQGMINHALKTWARTQKRPLSPSFETDDERRRRPRRDPSPARSSFNDHEQRHDYPPPRDRRGSHSSRPYDDRDGRRAPPHPNQYDPRSYYDDRSEWHDPPPPGSPTQYHTTQHERSGPSPRNRPDPSSYEYRDDRRGARSVPSTSHVDHDERRGPPPLPSPSLVNHDARRGQPRPSASGYSRHEERRGQAPTPPSPSSTSHMERPSRPFSPGHLRSQSPHSNHRGERHMPPPPTSPSYTNHDERRGQPPPISSAYSGQDDGHQRAPLPKTHPNYDKRPGQPFSRDHPDERREPRSPTAYANHDEGLGDPSIQVTPDLSDFRSPTFDDDTEQRRRISLSPPLLDTHAERPDERHEKQLPRPSSVSVNRDEPRAPPPAPLELAAYADSNERPSSHDNQRKADARSSSSDHRDEQRGKPPVASSSFNKHRGDEGSTTEPRDNVDAPFGQTSLPPPSSYVGARRASQSTSATTTPGLDHHADRGGQPLLRPSTFGKSDVQIGKTPVREPQSTSAAPSTEPNHHDNPGRQPLLRPSSFGNSDVQMGKTPVRDRAVGYSSPFSRYAEGSAFTPHAAPSNQHPSFGRQSDHGGPLPPSHAGPSNQPSSFGRPPGHGGPLPSRDQSHRQSSSTDRGDRERGEKHPSQRPSAPNPFDSIPTFKMPNIPQKMLKSFDAALLQRERKSPSPDPLFETPLTKHGRDWDYESPDTDDEGEPETLHQKISDRVDPLLQMDPEWQSFQQWRALPQSVPAVLKQYRFVQKLMDKYVGERVPFYTREHKMEKSHIVSALLIEDARFGSDCTETLNLVKLYGTHGTRLKDSRVSDMMADTRDPEYNAKPIKRFLRLLREVDEAWVKEHPEDAVASK